MSSSFQLELQRSSTVPCLACRHAFPPAVVLCPSLECRWRCQSGVPFLCYPYLVPIAQGWKHLLLCVWHNDLSTSAFLFESCLRSFVGPHIVVHLWHVPSNWCLVLSSAFLCNVAAIKFLYSSVRCSSFMTSFTFTHPQPTYLDGKHSSPRCAPVEQIFPTFAVRAEAGVHLLTSSGWISELAQTPQSVRTRYVADVALLLAV